MLPFKQIFPCPKAGGPATPGDGAGRSGRCPAAESKFVVIQRAPRDPLTVVDAISRALVMIAFDLDGTLSAPGRLQAGPGPVISCGCDRADQQHHGQINLPASSRKIGMARAGESTPDAVGNANRNVNDDVSSATRPATGTTA